MRVLRYNSTSLPPEVLRLNKIFRLFKLFKLLRLVRSSKVFTAMLSRTQLNPSIVRIAQLFAGLFMAFHWIGCLWYITAFIEDAPANWVKSTSVDSYSSLEDPGVTTYDKYIASWYFSVMTMSTIG